MIWKIFAIFQLFFVAVNYCAASNLERYSTFLAGIESDILSRQNNGAENKDNNESTETVMCLFNCICEAKKSLFTILETANSSKKSNALLQKLVDDFNKQFVEIKILYELLGEHANKNDNYQAVNFSSVPILSIDVLVNPEKRTPIEHDLPLNNRPYPVALETGIHITNTDDYSQIGERKFVALRE
ncbi:hypothetical protein FACS1894113_3860 [Alphaproteobacteria bacterium]|nr:hypothetical protein FACS1894113_3860 [Alphaproteobacteria bacterium]